MVETKEPNGDPSHWDGLKSVCKLLLWFSFWSDDYILCPVHFRHGKRKPRKRIRKFILELAADQKQEFGQKVSEFITEMRARSCSEPHQKMLLEVGDA